MSDSTPDIQKAESAIRDALNALWTGSENEADIINSLCEALRALGSTWQPPKEFGFFSYDKSIEKEDKECQ